MSITSMVAYLLSALSLLAGIAACSPHRATPPPDSAAALTDSAIAMQRRVLRTRPDEQPPYTFREIIALLDRALALDPKYDPAVRRKASILNDSAGATRWIMMRQNRPDSLVDLTLSLYDQALRLGPPNKVILANKAELLRSLERFDEAAHLYESWLAQHPEDYATRLVLGATLVENDQQARATPHLHIGLEALEQKMRAHPDSLGFFADHAMTLLLLLRYKEARAEIDSLVQAHPESLVLRDAQVWIQGSEGMRACL